MFLLKFHITQEENAISLSILHLLADEKHHLESSYKLGSLYRRETCSMSYSKNKKYFEKCMENKYYKAYSEYSILLYQENNIDKCKEVLNEGMENGYPKNIFLYYNIIMTTLTDFNNENNISVLKSLLDILLKDLVCGNFYSIFEFIYLQNIIKKYYDENFNEKEKYQEEIFHILDKYCDKNTLPTSFKELEIEIILSLAYYNYIGFQGNRNFIISEMLFKKAFKLGRNYSYKRFCYSYIFKIRKKRYNRLIKDLNAIFEKDEYNKVIKDVNISRNRLTKTKIKMQNLYNDSYKYNKLNEYSSSYFYYLAKIYENGYGVEKNRVVAGHFYHLGYTFRPKNLGSGSIIAYHRKEKCRIILLEGNFDNLDEDIKEVKLKHLDNFQEHICFICYTNEKQLLFFPCKHYLCCQICANKILTELELCPMCRTKILFLK